MNLADSRIEAQRACMDGLLVATEPRIFHTPGTEHVARNVDFGLPQIVDFAARHGNDPHALQSAAFYTYPRDAQQDYGGVTYWPHIIEGRIYTPVIGLGVPRDDLPLVGKLNNTLRHELRHIMQDCFEEVQPCDNPRVLRTIRAAGTLAAAYGVARYTGVLPEEADLGIFRSAALTVAGLTIASRPRELAHIVTPREIDARIFSRRTFLFRPIRIRNNPRTGTVKTVSLTPIPEN